MSTKTITMIYENEDGGAVSTVHTFDADCNWMALAYQFYTFLAAMGYRLDHEDVGSCVESFVNATQLND